MKKKGLFALVFFLLLALEAFTVPQKAFAASCSSMGVTVPPDAIKATYSSFDNNSIVLNLSGLQPNQEYRVRARGANADPTAYIGSVSKTSGADGTVSFTLDDPAFFEYRSGLGYKTINVILDGPGIEDMYCVLGSYSVVFDFQCGDIKVYQTNDAGQPCFAGGSGACTLGDKDTTVAVTLLTSNGEPAGNVSLIINVKGESDQDGKTEADGTLTKTFTSVSSGEHTVTIELNDYGTNKNLCSAKFSNSLNCPADSCKSEPTPIYTNGQAQVNSGELDFKLCDQIDSTLFPEQFDACVECVGGEGAENKDGVWTAIGCIKREPAQIAQALIKLGLMMGGGVALLMMLVAAFILSVSQGDPKRTEDARDMVTAAFMGLIFIIFSVTILQFIGFSILRIPGFGG